MTAEIIRDDHTPHLTDENGIDMCEIMSLFVVLFSDVTDMKKL